MTYYREKYGLNPADYPHSERIWKGCLSLPIYPDLRPDELRHICRSLREIFSGRGGGEAV